MRLLAKTPILLNQNYSKTNLRLLDPHLPHSSLSSFTSHWDSLFPAVAGPLHEEWSCIRVCSPVFPLQGRSPCEFWSRAHCFHSTSQPGNNNPTSGIQLLSQMILHCITTKPQGCSKHPQSANSIPLPEIRKQEHAQASPLSASSSSPPQLCWGLPTSVSQYFSHWLNCTCLPISQTNHKEPLV